jgi:hypothetical protein
MSPWQRSSEYFLSIASIITAFIYYTLSISDLQVAIWLCSLSLACTRIRRRWIPAILSKSAAERLATANQAMGIGGAHLLFIHPFEHIPMHLPV